MAPTAVSDSRIRRAVSCAPQIPSSTGALELQVSIMPPLRPLAPPPQMSRSTMTTSAAGSSSLMRSAVHRPVKPPPTMQTSALRSPSSGSGSAGSRASAS